MEIKEAKEIIETGFRWANWTDEQREAFLMAYKSLDKEIPQKVEKNERSSQACPVCKTDVNGKYCSFCGQKISYGY